MHDKQNTPATRKLILQHLKLEGPLDADALSGKLDITAMAVRQHLYALQEDSLITWESQAQGRGRPKKIWTLTENAERLFPNAHQDLALELIETLHSQADRTILQDFIDKRGRAQIARYRHALESAENLKDRIHILAKLRTDEGYMATVEKTGDGWVLNENHCPICPAARACSGLCANELEVFKASLGNTLKVERVEHILAGNRRCTYRVSDNKN